MTKTSRIALLVLLTAVGASGLVFPHPWWRTWTSSGSPGGGGEARTVEAAPLPSLAISRDVAAGVVKIELTEPLEDAGGMRTTRLERRGDRWRLEAPAKARASRSKVEELLENLTVLETLTVADHGSSVYDRFGLTDAEALHAVLWDEAGAKVVDLYFGKSDSRGQFARAADDDRVLTISNRGPRSYSGFLFTRTFESWRETSIFHFDEHDATAVEVTNRFGRYSFSRADGGVWTGAYANRDGAGLLPSETQPWPHLDPGRVVEFLHAYASLAADEFGTEENRATSGLDRADQVGGVVQIILRGKTQPLVLRVGALTKSKSRWAIPDSRWATADDSEGAIYALSPWTARWALGPTSLFEGPPDAGSDAAH